MEAVRKLNDDIRRRQIWTDDGIRLSLRYYGDDRAPIVLMAHGFGQTQYAWEETGRRLAAAGWQAVSYDARGHGESDRAPSGEYDFEQFIEDFRRVCDSLPNPPIVIGASMGGLTALLAHSEKPKVDLKALVLVDIAPRWDERGVSAMLAFMRQHPQGFATLDEAAEAIRGFLPHRRRNGGSSSSLNRNLRQASDGRWYWHWDPAMLALAEKSSNLQSRLQSASRRLKSPALLVTGGMSELIGAEHAEEFLKLAPHAEHAEVADAAHMVAGDANDRFLGAIMPFLKKQAQKGEKTS
ncbi:alpha/beta fold hydrolase [Wenzhouxiangella marina]|uniref:Peroxidase n=1 Tax=Wenzhouxiangella marina TaxID=1579979 RepID=A0A0K0XYX9_9GAMM|nr:alpha/beta hydrolase [Wenzhouxiangella marina]AKS42894.1 peroxidase [Wenzhouxiangella marina]MBB6087423.1 pimeloyl-ACP methyl ester carboxylesterase [Wenzhouxiangella marina]